MICDGGRAVVINFYSTVYKILYMNKLHYNNNSNVKF